MEYLIKRLPQRYYKRDIKLLVNACQEKKGHIIFDFSLADKMRKMLKEIIDLEKYGDTESINYIFSSYRFIKGNRVLEEWFSKLIEKYIK